MNNGTENLNVSRDEVEENIEGAFHYAKDSGNFGWNSNGKVRFGFFRPEYSGSLLERWSTYFGWNIPIEFRRSIFEKPVLCPNWGIRKLSKVARAIPIGWRGLIGKCRSIFLG